VVGIDVDANFAGGSGNQKSRFFERRFRTDKTQRAQAFRSSLALVDPPRTDEQLRRVNFNLGAAGFPVALGQLFDFFFDPLRAWPAAIVAAVPSSALRSFSASSVA
jgi:hypothetical protein